MADNIVVGKFSGDPNALAAVGSTSSLTNLILNVLMGIAAGTSVVISHAFGAKQDRLLSRAVHTSLSFSVIAGLAFMTVSLLVSRPGLILMGTKDVLLDSATLYMRIIACGIPATAIYNFSASILRSVGDSRTPLFILASSGIINVLLNIFFVIACGMSVDGVALATIVSQYISAAAAVAVLMRRKSESYALRIRELGIDIKILGRILRFGIPASIQSSLFGISNVLITSSINVFDKTVISGKTIAGNIEGILYVALNSYLHAAMTATGQNLGAGKPERIRRSVLYCVIQVMTIGIVGGMLILTFGESVASLFVDTTDPLRDEVIEKAMDQMKILLTTYFLCGIMESLSGSLRGMGYSMTPTVMSIGGVCGIRILWILTAFQLEALHSPQGLFLVYPISWIATSLMFLPILLYALSKQKKANKGLQIQQN
jgi:putative MATE family efflux protein